MLTSLGQVDDRSAHQGAEDTTLEYLLADSHIMAKLHGRTYVADGESTTGHILNGELVVTSLSIRVSKLISFSS
jgi:hypothetical protein